jgi:hypothetical protein
MLTCFVMPAAVLEPVQTRAAAARTTPAGDSAFNSPADRLTEVIN